MKQSINLSAKNDGPGIIKVYKQPLPAMRFIGKNYGTGNHPDWGDAFNCNIFGKIEDASGSEEKSHSLYEDADAYIGLYYLNSQMNGYDGWVGMFAFPGTEVPEGLQYIDFPEQNIGVCWIYGKRNEVYNYISQCPDALKSAGIEIKLVQNLYLGHFERDLCPRFTTPDEKGNIILDYCYFIK